MSPWASAILKKRSSSTQKGWVLKLSRRASSIVRQKLIVQLDCKTRRLVWRCLKGPNAFLELWQYTNPEPKDLRSRPCDYGYPHFALQVDDIQVEYDRLKTHGMEFVGEVVHFGDTSSAIYGRDPCGNVIELYEIKTPDIAQLER